MRVTNSYSITDILSILKWAFEAGVVYQSVNFNDEEGVNFTCWPSHLPLECQEFEIVAGWWILSYLSLSLSNVNKKKPHQTVIALGNGDGLEDNWYFVWLQNHATVFSSIPAETSCVKFKLCFQWNLERNVALNMWDVKCIQTQEHLQSLVPPNLLFSSIHRLNMLQKWDNNMRLLWRTYSWIHGPTRIPFTR